MSAQPARKVYLDYTQAELDRAYDQRAWALNADEVIRRYAIESARARERFKAILDVAYGPSPEETLDIFPAAQPGAPLHVHIHGGGWRNLSKDEESFLANALVPAGASLVVLNFATIPKVRIPEMVEQARRAIAWLYANAIRYTADPDAIHVSGHSSGGHMAAVLLATDWSRRRLPADVVKSGLVMSGSYDLRPVMLSARSSYVKLSAEEALELSPILHVDRVRAPLTVAFGALESPEYKRHAHSLAEAMKAAGKAVSLLDCGPFNHFEVLEELGRPGTPLARAALQLMELEG
jgi:arylformamidase